MAECEGIAQSHIRGGSGWILEKVSILGVIKHWNKLPGEMVDAPPLSVLERTIPSIMFFLVSLKGWAVGLDYL